MPLKQLKKFFFGPGPHIAREEAIKIFRRDHFKCQYCGLDGMHHFESWLVLTIDHVHPHSHGGSRKMNNLVTACRHFGKFPTTMEMRIYRKVHTAFPNEKSVLAMFGGKENTVQRLGEWARSRADYEDVATILPDISAATAQSQKAAAVEGFVYLIRWGANYKIGRGEDLERRVKQVRTGLPDSGELVHAIRTDDPPGIEAYWHRRFVDKRAPNGEWFKLNAADVAAFKRRKFQ